MNETTGKLTQELHTLRRELIGNAAAARPLPPLRTDRGGLAVLPERVRNVLRWLPHAVLVGCAGVLFVFSWQLYGSTAFVSEGYSYASRPGPSLLLGLAAAMPLILTMLRPIAAWWLSLIGTFTAAAALASDPWPFAETTFASHLLVMVMVVLRSRPVVAAAMWLITVVAGWAAVELYHPRDDYLSVNNVFVFAAWSGLALILAVAMSGWLAALREVVAKDELTVIERGKRTVLEERTTIARELHDVVAHHMSVVAIQAEAAPYRVTDPPPELVKSFATIRENAVAALAELRRVLGVIRVGDYETYDAPEAPQPTLDALDGLLANVREAGLPVEKVVTGARRELPQGVELSAFRIIQEALSNVLRHASGADARVELAYVPVGLGVRIVNGPVIADEVPGAEAVATGGLGHGLTGMRERVAMLDGELTSGETDDGGYEVVAFLPAPAAPAAPAAQAAEEPA
ncbi:sensor histidine kinase [Streptomyces boninensis]|uniref:sensor histidine kinase n=1 Tax=Streptomyces boninensis TaxID=2039455 RepID=UPI003B20B62D